MHTTYTVGFHSRRGEGGNAKYQNKTYKKRNLGTSLLMEVVTKFRKDEILHITGIYPTSKQEGSISKQMVQCKSYLYKSIV